MEKTHNSESFEAMEITEGSENVFEDLGFEKEEAANLNIRTHLMISLRRFIEEQGMTQEQAGSFFGVSQPRISDLVNRKLDKFTIDSLVNMHATAGMDVHVDVVRGKRTV